MIVYHIRMVGNSNLNEGYIGVTNDIKKRISSHKRDAKTERRGRLLADLVNGNHEVVTIMEGSIKECLAKEKELRPLANIGANMASGGSRNGGCAWAGKKRPEHSAMMKESLKGNVNGNKSVYAAGFIFESRRQAAKFLNVDYKTIYNRMKNDKMKDFSFLPA